MPPIHRTLKNVVKNYSYAEVKVREATSNDPWGPSTSLMAEIAELTHDLAAFIEIMAMIWRRINDHGKNWRHVYKSLVLLEYLVRFGQEGVAVQCKESLVAIKTLQDFQHVEDGKDQGHSVREKARQLVALLTDPEQLRAERSKSGGRARYGGYTSDRNDTNFNSSPVLSHERYAPRTPSSYAAPSAAPSDRAKERFPVPSPSPVPMERERNKERVPVPTTNRAHQASKPRASPRSDLSAAQPAGSNEEDLQLQMALAMSREQHEEEERLRKGDEIKLQMAIEESKKTAAQRERMYSNGHTASPRSLDHSLVDPWSGSTNQQTVYSQPADPWGDRSGLAKEPWEIEATAGRTPQTRASFSGAAAGGRSHNNEDEFSELDNRYREQQTAKNRSIETWLESNLNVDDKKDDIWRDGSDVSDLSDLDKQTDDKPTGKKVTPEEFLGPHAKLVDFNELVSKPAPASVLNPFAITIGKSAPAVNPFTARAQEEERSKRVPLNQLQPNSDSSFGGGGHVLAVPSASWPAAPAAVAVVYTAQPPPSMVHSSPGYNPFL